MSVPSVCLVVLDGWGLAPDGPGNAVSLAKTPVFDELWDEHPHTTLTAMGPSVGLPEGQMGNSEVGHLNLGAGAIVPQDLARIDAAVEDGTLAENEVLQAALRDAPRVHLIGLVSDGGVHSSDRHLKALIELAAEWGIDDLVVHAFTDGRDTSPTGGVKYLAEVQGWMEEVGAGRIGSVIGRYFAMDRDKRWDRVQKAYDLLVHGKAEHHADTGAEAAQAAYDRDETDEFIAADDGRRGGEDPPRRRRDGVQLPPGPDARDHARAVPTRTSTRSTAAAPAWSSSYATLAEYDEDWDYPVVFPPKRPALTIGEVISREGKGQLHVAETEKYPHVTYFFNGGEEKPYEGEVRELVPSPRDVPTYDFKPEMSAREATDAFVKHFEAEKPAFCDHQLRQPGHGRPHRCDPGRRDGGRDRRRVPRPRRRGGARGRRRLPRHRRPRQLRPHAQRRRLAEHRALAEPGAVHRHRRRRRARRRGHPRRRRADGARAARRSSSRTR